MRFGVTTDVEARICRFGRFPDQQFTGRLLSVEEGDGTSGRRKSVKFI